MLVYDIGKPIVMLIGGSVVGLLYVLVLPFAWIVAAAVIVLKGIFGGLIALITGNTAFGWRPREAYLTGKKKKKTEKKDT